MIRKYALFSQNKPRAHMSLITLAMLCSVTCMVLLLSQEENSLVLEDTLILIIGLLTPALPLIIFAKAAEYRRKYLRD